MYHSWLDSMFFFRKDLEGYMLLFLILLGLGSLSEILNPLIRALKMWNGGIMNSYTILCCFLFICIYVNSDSLKKSWAILSFTLLILGCSYFILTNKNGFHYMDNRMAVYTNYILMFLSATSLIKMTNGVLDDLFSYPLFWISVAVLFYYTTSNISYSLFPNDITKLNPAFQKQLWSVHSVLNISCNFLYVYAFICHYRKIS